MEDKPMGPNQEFGASVQPANLSLLSSSAKAARKYRQDNRERQKALDEAVDMEGVDEGSGQNKPVGVTIQHDRLSNSSQNAMVETAIPIKPTDAFQLSSSAKAAKKTRQESYNRRQALDQLKGGNQTQDSNMGTNADRQSDSSYEAMVETAIPIKPVDAFQLSSSGKAAKKTRQEYAERRGGLGVEN